MKTLAISISLLVPALAWAQPDYYNQGRQPQPQPVRQPASGYEASASVEWNADVPEFYDDFSSAAAATIDHNAPDLDFVWVDAQFNGTHEEPGFYRLRSRPGFRWVDGHFDRRGTWNPPGWMPTRHTRGTVWVRGHRGADGFWVAGQLRPERRPGFVWVKGFWSGGTFVSGFWRPERQTPSRDHIWVRGFWTRDGQWVEGFWRERGRRGFVWNRGEWRYGEWVPGFWKPTQARPGYEWSPGHWQGNTWVEGQWHPKARNGFVWIDGHWDLRGQWVEGHWQRKRANRHPVVRVQDIRRQRRDFRREWRDGRILRHTEVRVRDTRTPIRRTPIRGNSAADRVERRTRTRTRTRTERRVERRNGVDIDARFEVRPRIRVRRRDDRR